MDRRIEPERGSASSPPVFQQNTQSGEYEEPIEGAPVIGGTDARFPDFVFLLRPMILIPVWTFFLLGARHASTATGTVIQARLLFAGLCSFTAAFGVIYIINQIADRETDLANRKLFLIPYSIISIKAAWTETALLIAAAFVIGILVLSTGYTIVLALTLAVGAAYSLEPVRFKRRAILDVCANAVLTGVLNTLAGWIAIGAPLSGLHVLLPYPLAVASVHLTTTLADIDGDARSGLRTSGVELGSGRGKIVSVFLMIIALAAAAVVGNRVAFYASLFSLPFFLVTARPHAKPAAHSGVLLPAKVATLVFSFTAGFFFRPYIPFLAVVILLTRLYYRRRFGMSYPSL